RDPDEQAVVRLPETAQRPPRGQVAQADPGAVGPGEHLAVGGEGGGVDLFTPYREAAQLAAACCLAEDERAPGLDPVDEQPAVAETGGAEPGQGPGGEGVAATVGACPAGPVSEPGQQQGGEAGPGDAVLTVGHERLPHAEDAGAMPLGERPALAPPPRRGASI